MSKRRVVVTGMGCVTPYGIGVDTLWNNIIKGISGIRRHNLDQEKHVVKVAGQVPEDIDIAPYVDLKEAKSGTFEFKQGSKECALSLEQGFDKEEINSLFNEFYTKKGENG